MLWIVRMHARLWLERMWWFWISFVFLFYSAFIDIMAGAHYHHQLKLLPNMLNWFLACTICLLPFLDIWTSCLNRKFRLFVVTLVTDVWMVFFLFVVEFRWSYLWVSCSRKVLINEWRTSFFLNTHASGLLFMVL